MSTWHCAPSPPGASGQCADTITHERAPSTKIGPCKHTGRLRGDRGRGGRAPHRPGGFAPGRRADYAGRPATCAARIVGGWDRAAGLHREVPLPSSSVRPRSRRTLQASLSFHHGRVLGGAADEGEGSGDAVRWSQTSWANSFNVAGFWPVLIRSLRVESRGPWAAPGPPTARRRPAGVLSRSSTVSNEGPELLLNKHRF